MIRALALGLLLLVAGCAEFDYDPDAAPARAAPAPAAGVYEVRRGDTLYSIAWRHGVDYRRLARWNGIAFPYTIYPGQRLRLKPSAGAPARSAAAPAREARSPSAPASRPPREPQPAERRGAAPTLAWRWPVDGPVLRGFSRGGDGKRGIAIGGSLGQTVQAAAPGRVVYSGSGLRGYGNLVIVKHSDRYLTAYGYNRELLVQEGDRVGVGDAIARMGLGPGRQAALHFELRRDGEPVDPARYLPDRR